MGKTILLAENDPMLAQAINRMLSDCDVTIVTEPKELLDLMENKFDVVIGDGTFFCSDLGQARNKWLELEKQYSLNLVIISGDLDTDFAPLRVITKPFNIKEIRELIRKAAA